MNESEDTEEVKTLPLYPYLLHGQQALPNCKPISVGSPGDARYMTPLPHPTTTPSNGKFSLLESDLFDPHVDFYSCIG